MPTWRAIPGFTDYEASDDGQVRPVRPRYTRGRGLTLKPWIVERHGRRAAYVTLHVGGKRVKQLVHRLVCLAFHGEPRDDASDCCHINHSSLDNRASNLRWGTHAENIADTYTEDARERRAILLETLEVYAGPSDGLPF